MKIQKGWNLPVLVAVVAMILPAFAGAYPAEVARTGQTKCYVDNGTETVCAGTGQDGEIQAGVSWPDQRFIDNGDGTVKDSLTGLVWAQNANLPNGSMTWQSALQYVAGMNAGTNPNLGHTDWRLPNINELESLVDSGFYRPALPHNHPFTNVKSKLYWSSTTCDYHADGAWFVNMYDGAVVSFYYVGYGSKTASSNYVWPVHSGECGASVNSVICLPKTGQTKCYDSSGNFTTCAGTGQDGEFQKGVAWPDPRFIDNGDGTVTDGLTGLEWIKDLNYERTTWQGALDSVETFTTGGHTDWRLPNRRELRSLINYGKSRPALLLNYPFTYLAVEAFWTSTSRANDPRGAWIIGIDGGLAYIGSKGSKPDIDYNSFWPVRSGHVDNSTSTTTTTMPGSTTTTIATTTTTVPGKPCPAKNVLGEKNPKLENLRDFRDSNLAQSTIGRKIIQIYYNNAAGINAAFDRSPALQAAAKMALEAVALAVEKRK